MAVTAPRGPTLQHILSTQWWGEYLSEAHVRVSALCPHPLPLPPKWWSCGATTRWGCTRGMPPHAGDAILGGNDGLEEVRGWSLGRNRS